MHVVCVANQKGGVGKTTTSLSLAASLAAQGRRVLALDLDPQGNFSAGLGLPEGVGDGPTLYEVLTGPTSLVDAARGVGIAGLESLRVGRAGPRLAQAEAELLGQVGFDEVLKHKLRAARGAFDVAVIDCPPSLGALTINAVGAADLVVAPVQCEFFSARGVVKLMQVIELVRERRNPALQLRLVPSLYDGRNNICRAVLAQLTKEFPGEVSAVTIGVDTRVRESQARGLPVSIYAPRCRASRAYAELADEITDLFAAPSAAEESAHTVGAQGGLHVQAA